MGFEQKGRNIHSACEKYITNEKKSFTLSAANKFFELQEYQDLLDTMQGLSIDKLLWGLAVNQNPQLKQNLFPQLLETQTQTMVIPKLSLIPFHPVALLMIINFMYQ